MADAGRIEFEVLPDGLLEVSDSDEEQPPQMYTSTQYFTEIDIVMLREVLTEKIHPCGKGKQVCEAWEKIAAKVNLHLKKKKKSVTARQTRDRAKSLFEKFKKDEVESAKKSGVDEEFDELMSLLTEIASLESELQKKDRKKAEKDPKIAQGLIVRKRAMESLKPETLTEDEENNTEDGMGTPTSAKKAKQSQRQEVLQYLKEKNDNENELKKAEMELKREQLELERQHAKQMENLILLLAEKK